MSKRHQDEFGNVQFSARTLHFNMKLCYSCNLSAVLMFWLIGICSYLQGISVVAS